MATSSEVKALLRRRYQHPEWAICFEVANSTGAGSNRYADAVAMNLWPSRGLAFYGFEIKVSKQDFLNEVKNPEKSVAVQQYCDQWWIVAPAKAVDEALLPKAWGWMRVDEDRLVVVKQAPELEPKPIDRKFMAAMVRRANEADTGEMQKAVSLEVERIRANDRQQIESEIARRSRKADEAIKTIEEIKQKIGTDGWDWLSSDDIARAVKMVREAGVASTYGNIRDLHRQMNTATKRLGDALDKALGKQDDLPLKAAE